MNLTRKHSLPQNLAVKSNSQCIEAHNPEFVHLNRAYFVNKSIADVLLDTVNVFSIDQERFLWLIKKQTNYGGSINKLNQNGDTLTMQHQSTWKNRFQVSDSDLCSLHLMVYVNVAVTHWCLRRAVLKHVMGVFWIPVYYACELLP